MLATSGRCKVTSEPWGEPYGRRTEWTEGIGRAELLRGSDRTCQVVEKIAAIPATTLTGLRVNAKAVTWMETDDYKPSAMNDFEWSLHQEVFAGVLALVSVD